MWFPPSNESVTGQKGITLSQNCQNTTVENLIYSSIGCTFIKSSYQEHHIWASMIFRHSSPPLLHKEVAEFSSKTLNGKSPDVVSDERTLKLRQETVSRSWLLLPYCPNSVGYSANVVLPCYSQ